MLRRIKDDLNDIREVLEECEDYFADFALSKYPEEEKRLLKLIRHVLGKEWADG